jgi:hypothetical protein
MGMNIRFEPCCAVLILTLSVTPHLCRAQDLAPRAYVITPIHSNAVTLSYSLLDGDILFDSALPIKGARGQINLSTVSVYHAFNFFGRSSNITIYLPYAVATLEGQVNSAGTKVYRSGLMDAVCRLSVNLKGGPSMSPSEFRTWRQGTIIGASLKVLAPSGQYDPSRLINTGTNRWAFKPEVGLSRRWGHWLLDTYLGTL